MALGYPNDVTGKYKQGVYSIQLDVSGWDKVTIQPIAPIAAPLGIYGSNDGGAVFGITDGNAELAINFTAIQATNLATGSAVSTMATQGLYTVPVNAQFLKISGGGADVYKLLLFNSKIS